MTSSKTNHYPTALLESFSATENTEARIALFEADERLRRPDAVQALCNLAVRLLQVDLDRADKTARSAAWLSSQLDDPRSTAFSTRALGNVHLLRGQPSQALRSYATATRIFEALQDREQVANTHLNQITALIQLGDKAEVISLAREARAIFQDLKHDLGIARLENNLGILYHRQEDTERARFHWEAAYKRFVSLDQNHDAAIALRNLAVAAITGNDYHTALSLYKQVRDYCKKHGLAVLIHEIDYNIAYLFFLRGDYEQAVLGFRQARSRSQQRGDLYHAALCDLDETELYLEVNLLRDATELADRAISSFRQLQMRHETAKALAFRGIAASRLGDPRLAISYLRSSREEFDAEENRAWSSLIQLYEALVFQHEGRLFEARRAAQGALAGFDALEAPVKSALCHLVLSQLSFLESALVKAQTSCERAAQLLQDADLPPLKFQTFLTSGEILEAQGQLDEAEVAYRAAENLLETMRSRVSTEELRLPLTTDRLAVYDRLLAALVFSSKPLPFHEAFRLVEKSKARSLSDLLASRVTPFSGTTRARSSLVEQVRGLREELNWYYKRLAHTDYTASAPSRRSLQSLRTSLDETEQKLAASLAKISETDLELGSLHHALTIDFDQIRSALTEDEVVLQYFVGRDVVYLLTFSRSVARCEAIAVPEEVNELRRLVEFQLSRQSSTPSEKMSARSSEKTRRYFQQLSSLLIGPVKDVISEYGRITVVPHSFLFYIPFHSLHLEEHCLEDRWQLVCAPSASSFFFGRQSDLKVSKRALAFLNSASSNRLPKSQLERHWKTTWIPVTAPLSEWRANLREEWALIHLPLKTTYRQDNPIFSAVRIAREQQTLLDVFSLSLKCAVLVVTGCGHLPGRRGSGDELVALSRSLLFSGPKTLVFPLWQVRAEAEILFLGAFYDALAGGLSPCSSVSEARRVTREVYPHPFDWAAWVVFGA